MITDDAYITQLAGELCAATREQPITAPIEAAPILADTARLVDTAHVAELGTRDQS